MRQRGHRKYVKWGDTSKAPGCHSGKKTKQGHADTRGSKTRDEPEIPQRGENVHQGKSEADVWMG